MNKNNWGFVMIILVSIGIAGISWKVAEHPQSQQETVIKISKDSLYNQYITKLYQAIGLDRTGLEKSVFEKALTGYYNMKYSGLLNDKAILTIADFDQLSSCKRFYIIDLCQKKLILNTWVAHGQNSGGNQTTNFSNEKDSNESSLGFYLTGETYTGKHGRSLKLDGMDEGFNDHARERSIVVHGADYVSQESINQLGRLGRSQGCPAVPANLANQVINTISEHTVLFINNSAQHYQSQFLNEQLAASLILSENSVLAAVMD
ncbi:murein L,D-transpeptidase catalytic domain family protein [Pedobacter changchengzhani]|uniref:Murein L,D-transpeptidase catalytic domain family protein n=1 Tax=Pedobacter changchengzhani TaxID=2529274 RepID=A0A4R5MKW9_9SPHI|nr:murein L,D-transpeptidase catalytic domain family protein [Pedobacter changchengzhani]TDG35845.1 murein L,D-transpeptidase catalytic domain family protein [Pedobacter changchengzhani]